MEGIRYVFKVITWSLLIIVTWYGVWYFFIVEVNPLLWSFWQKFWYSVICLIGIKGAIEDEKY